MKPPPKHLQCYPPPFSIYHGCRTSRSWYGLRRTNHFQQKYKRPAVAAHAKGGLIDTPTMSLMGEAGAELVAP